MLAIIGHRNLRSVAAVPPLVGRLREAQVATGIHERGIAIAPTSPMTKFPWAVPAAIVLLAGASDRRLAAQPEKKTENKTENEFDPEADTQLKKMSDYLASLKSMTFVADHTTEAVLTSGQKVEFGARSDVSIQRPNRVRSDRVGQLADGSFFYDGKTFTVFGARKNMYATAEAPPTINEAIDVARTKLGLEIPAADLLVDDVYNSLREGKVAGKYLGKVELDGILCHHIAYQGKDTDFQLWVQDGSKPLPRKYVITTKDEESQPEFTVRFSNWDLNPQLPDDLFAWKPPQNAEKIQFLSVLESRQKKGAKK